MPDAHKNATATENLGTKGLDTNAQQAVPDIVIVSGENRRFQFRIIADRTDVNQNMKSWRLPIIFHCNVRVDNQLRAEYQLSLYLHWLTNSNPRPIAPNECITSNRVCTLGGFGSALQA